MSRKVFTAGEVLAAADVNSFLMDQTVMSFAGTAARGSAIPSPVTGMTTYLEDTKDLRIYDGSAYRSPFGMTQLVNEDFSGVASVTVDNVFTSEFENYKIILRADSNSASTNRAATFQFRQDGSTITTSAYSYGLFYQNMNSAVFDEWSQALNTTAADLLQYGFTNTSSVCSVELYSPQVLRHTSWTLQNQSNYNVSTNKVAIFGSGYFASTAQLDGFTISSGGGNFVGNVKVYGYRS
jgi:hypothetical protein